MLGNNRDYKTADRRARKQLRIHAENMKQLMELGHSKEHASRIALQMMERKHDPNYEYPVGWPYPFCQECYQVHEGIKGDGQEREIKNNSNQQEEPTMKTEEKKAGHTPGKVTVRYEYTRFILFADKRPFGHFVGWSAKEQDGNPDGVTTEDEDMANARRIKATWNDCNGIPTEALENGVVGELLEACEEIKDIFSPTQTGWSERTRKALKKVEAALVKAKGE